MFQSDDDNEADVDRVDDVVSDEIIKLRDELRDELETTEKLNEKKKKGTKPRQTIPRKEPES